MTGKQWSSYARRIEKENLLAHGRSLTFIGIARRAYGHIIEQREDDVMLVRPGWQVAMRQEPNP